MAPVIRCTVRDCGAALTRAGEALRCARGHAFDRAREGYWNLLQPQDRRSARPGDTAVALEARRRWLARGFADDLLATAGRLLAAHDWRPGSTVLDLGCGEGTLARRFFGAREVSYVGVDLSTPACSMAARHWPQATILVANLDRSLPALDDVVDLVVSFFGRRPWAQVARVLRPGGLFLSVQPAPEDLIELRAAVLGAGHRRERAAVAARAAVDGAGSGVPGLSVLEVVRWSSRHLHEASALRDALDMSYRGGRAAREARLAEIPSLELTLAADIMLWRRDGGR